VLDLSDSVWAGGFSNSCPYFPARLQPFTCTYLGIPLALRKLLQPLIHKISCGLPTWKAGLLNRAGRTVLTKVKLSAIPLSPWVIKCIDKRRHAFFWTGTEMLSGGHCLLAWPKCCRPAELGGLGLSNLQVFGQALRLRWLWFRKTDQDRRFCLTKSSLKLRRCFMLQSQSILNGSIYLKFNIFSAGH
jgi:hypothetical protein